MVTERQASRASTGPSAALTAPSVAPTGTSALPAGFSLVEVIVALTLMTVGILGAVAAQNLAARLLGAAEARSGAVAIASGVLDLLLAAPEPKGGTRVEGRYSVHWSVTPVEKGRRLELTVEYHTGPTAHSLHFTTLHLTPPRWVTHEVRGAHEAGGAHEAEGGP